MTHIVTQPQTVIAGFVAMRQGKPFAESWGHHSTLGLVRGNTLIAGVVYNNWEAQNVCAHIGAIDGAHWLTPAFLRAMFEYPFIQAGKRRITALVAKRNRRARKFVEHLGFTYEGALRHYFADDSLIVYGMLREQCRFIDQAPRERKAA